MNIKDDLAGRKIRCPACKSILAVPAAKKVEPEPVLLEVVEDDEPAEALPVRPSRRAAIQAEPPEVLPARRRVRDEEDEEEQRPVKRRPKLRRESSRGRDVAVKQSGLGGINAGVGGGLLMILIAVVWFVAGAAVGVYFIYPPILAVIGVVAIIKGLVGGGD